ncbi:MAG: copper resistance protein CopC [Dehalococcoidia bacterium]|nr:copper resistance protein CopC [Dehalococcoidia bacterium]
MRRTLLAVFVAMAIVAMARPMGASAHAALLRAEPGENSYVQRAPAEVALVFSEPLSARQSSIQVLDANGNALVLPPAEVMDDRMTLRVALPVLQPGIYNVLWTNVSTIDGHALRGAYPFTVLRPDGSLPDQVNSLGGLTTDTDPAPLADGVAVRALALLGLLLAAAGALVLLLGFEGKGAAQAASRVVLLGAAVLASATVLNIWTLRDVYRDLALLDVLIDTRAGNYLIARYGATVLIAVMATFAPDNRRMAAWGALGGIAVFLWSFTATSHAAAGAGSNWAQAIDMAHGVTAVLWIGAVIGLALAARVSLRDGKYAAFLPRFSLLASVLVFVLLATGFLSSLVQLDTPARLWETRYGITLTVKLGLMVVLLALGLYNARRGRHRLAALAPGEPRRFIAVATAEALLGVGVFVAAAMLTQTTVAKSIPEGRAETTFDRTVQAGGLNLRLQVDPNRTGMNTFKVTVTEPSGAPFAADRVRLTFRYQDDQTVGPSNLVLAAQGGAGTYVGAGPYLPLEGNWRIETEVRRPNADDAIGYFDIRPAGAPVVSVARSGAWANPAAGMTSNEFAGFAALLAGAGIAIFRRELAKLGKAWSRGSTATTALCFGFGTLLLFGVHRDAPLSTNLPSNPIYPDQNSIAAGRTLYTQQCASCHGSDGHPPAGLDLNPYPLDLTVHAPQHPDGQIYLFIRDGVPQSEMRAWGKGAGKLSEEQMWHLVNFIRTTFRPPDR